MKTKITDFITQALTNKYNKRIVQIFTLAIRFSFLCLVHFQTFLFLDLLVMLNTCISILYPPNHVVSDRTSTVQYTMHLFTSYVLIQLGINFSTYYIINSSFNLFLLLVWKTCNICSICIHKLPGICEPCLYRWLVWWFIFLVYGLPLNLYCYLYQPN